MGALTKALVKVRNAAKHFSLKSKATSFEGDVLKA
jgi:hypothetical protein